MGTCSATWTAPASVGPIVNAVARRPSVGTRFSPKARLAQPRARSPICIGKRRAGAAWVRRRPQRQPAARRALPLDASSGSDAGASRLLLLCLLLRSSWLTVERDRHIGAAGVLHRQGGRAAVAVSVGVAVGVPEQPPDRVRFGLGGLLLSWIAPARRAPARTARPCLVSAERTTAVRNRSNPGARSTSELTLAFDSLASR